jgi:acyl-CoA thioesterase-1
MRLRVLKTQLILALLLAIASASGFVIERGDDASLHIIAFGDSLSSGQGLSVEAGFPGALETRLRADGYNARVINAGVPGDTSSMGLARLKDIVRKRADLVILEFGANDVLRQVEPSVFRNNLDAMINGLKARRIRVLVAGMNAAPEFGLDYKQAFNSVYPELARAHAVALHPFLLERMFDAQGHLIRAFLQGDGAHPNADGIRRIVGDIAPLVERELDAIVSGPKRIVTRLPLQAAISDQ